MMRVAFILIFTFLLFLFSGYNTNHIQIGTKSISDNTLVYNYSKHHFLLDNSNTQSSYIFKPSVLNDPKVEFLNIEDEDDDTIVHRKIVQLNHYFLPATFIILFLSVLDNKLKLKFYNNFIYFSSEKYLLKCVLRI